MTLPEVSVPYGSFQTLAPITHRLFHFQNVTLPDFYSIHTFEAGQAYDAHLFGILFNVDASVPDNTGVFFWLGLSPVGGFSFGPETIDSKGGSVIERRFTFQADTDTVLQQSGTAPANLMEFHGFIEYSAVPF